MLSLVAAASMWLYVQHVLIPYQTADAQVTHRPRGNLSDLYPRWFGARALLLERRDPYGSDVTREIQAGYYGRPLDSTRPNDPKDQQAFAYPLYVVLLLAPTIGLPFPVVQSGFLILEIIVTAASVCFWLGVLRWRLSRTRILMLMFLVLGSFPAIQGLKLQQLSLLVAALLAAAMYQVLQRRLIWAGILLAIASIKPQLVGLIVLWLAVWLSGNWKERHRLFWSYLASMSVLVLGGELMLPGWIQEFRAASAAYYRYTGGNSVLDIALTPTLGKAASICAVLGLLIRAWQLRRADAGTPDFEYSLGLALATTLMVMPMFAPYNQVLLVPVLLMVARAVYRCNRLCRVLILTAFATIAWEWLAAFCLVVALLIFPAKEVQRAWMAPFYTSLAIPVASWAALVVGLRERSRTAVSIGK